MKSWGKSWEESWKMMGKLRISPTKIKELKYLPYDVNIKIDGICVPSFRITDCLAWRFGIGRSQILPAKWLDWKPKTHSMYENQWLFYDRSRPLPSFTLPQATQQFIARARSSPEAALSEFYCTCISRDTQIWASIGEHGEHGWSGC